MLNQPRSVAALTQGARADVVSAIRQASTQTGVDFSYLMQKAAAESSLNPQAQASTSSARGLFQFIDQTWLETLHAHGAEHGLGQAAALITPGSNGQLEVKDPAMRREILAMRDNPRIAAMMAAELAKDNQTSLEHSLGRKVGNAEMYMAHFLGAGGAARFLATLDDNPQGNAASVVPAAANANQAVFYENGKSLTVNQVYAHFAEKFGEDTNVATPAKMAPQTATIAALNAYVAASRPSSAAIETEDAALPVISKDAPTTFRIEDLSIKTPLQTLPMFALAILEAMSISGDSYRDNTNKDPLKLRNTA